MSARRYPPAVHALINAARKLDTALVTQETERLLARMASDGWLPEVPLRRLLDLLRRKQFLGPVEVLASASIAAGVRDPAIRRMRVQANIDAGRPEAALSDLDVLVQEATVGSDGYAEAVGLRGRVYKELFLLEGTSPLKETALRMSIRSYLDVYLQAPQRFLWHGINAVALLRLGSMKGIDLTGYPSGEAIARRLLVQIHRRGARVRAWDQAVAVEANIALERWDQALRWAVAYAANPAADAFELSSTLRHLELLWGLNDVNEAAARIVVDTVRHGLLRRNGGGMEVPVSEVQEVELEGVFDGGEFVTYHWFKEAIHRARCVAFIQDRMKRAMGTGFLVRGKTFADVLPDQWFVLTNSHVVTHTPDGRGVRPMNAVVQFQGLRQTLGPFTGVEIVWSSPTGVLDAALLHIPDLAHAELPVTTYPIAQEEPELAEKTRIYVIGHPAGRPLSISLYGNQMVYKPEGRLHYRAPTEGGSSGSPVFDRDWQLVGLHRGTVRPEFPPPGFTAPYEANEAVTIRTLRAAIVQTYVPGAPSSTG